MKLYELLIGKFSVYVVAKNEEHAKYQAMEIAFHLAERGPSMYISGMILCEADTVHLERYHH
ncbi:hypothetical protein [Serratia odorifera]|jgi:hypothetical protein|uniref:Uncharacterized protein n=2 Tax=Serratia odorifera TaxID=618 RepID=D4E7A5_SEROD|nr:hypothetical protein [Serratia odorifera]EFE94481.1 hypothetical protein HMPREF0758_4055 [Serratia odorifera DSM 4582]PNK89160.1 hypothetical protein CEQ31_005310 [Serratia odorifera]RII70288.1 hypothetical protein DX901_20995 [Serratia odorifera]VDZ64036.1 Uncharacterised protein [Serratia odorifera]